MRRHGAPLTADMTDRVIPLLDLRTARLPVPPAAPGHAIDGHVVDRLGRPLRDLRISVTDRCNFRCTYCMPRRSSAGTTAFLPHADLLTLRGDRAAGARVRRPTASRRSASPAASRCCAGPGAADRDARRAATPDGRPLDLTLTTNGSLLARKARALAGAGLRRVTGQPRRLDDAMFQRMNDVDFPVAEVLAGIDAAAAAGLGPIKINMVVKRGVNEHEHRRRWRAISAAAAISSLHRVHGRGPHQRLAHGRRGAPAEVIERIGARRSARAGRRQLPRRGRGALALPRRRRRDRRDLERHARVLPRLHAGAPVHRGQLYLCLFADSGYDLRRLLRRDGDEARIDDAELAAAVASIWSRRGDRYSELRTQASAARPKVEMSYIGG